MERFSPRGILLAAVSMPLFLLSTGFAANTAAANQPTTKPMTTLTANTAKSTSATQAQNKPMLKLMPSATKPAVKTVATTSSPAADNGSGALVKLAQDATLSAFSYNYQNYKKQFDTTSKFFTPEGWSAFSKALKKSNNIAEVKNNKMSVTAKLDGKVSLKKQKIVNGEKTWQVLVPIAVTYSGMQQNILQNLDVSVTLVPVDKTVNAQGFAITQFIAKPRKQSS